MCFLPKKLRKKQNEKNYPKEGKEKKKRQINPNMSYIIINVSYCLKKKKKKKNRKPRSDAV